MCMFSFVICAHLVEKKKHGLCFQINDKKLCYLEFVSELFTTKTKKLTKTGTCPLNEIMHVKHLARFLAHGKFFKIFSYCQAI